MPAPRLGIVTSGFPYTHKEAFLLPELAALSQNEVAATVYPVHPRLADPCAASGAELARLPLVSIRIVASALRVFAANPRRVLGALGAVILRGRLKTRAKNAAVFCKALAVAEDMRRRGIEHVHAYWASTPATVAYIAALVNGIPWSFTAHRWDIYEDNLLVDKLRTAQFARVISSRGRDMLVGYGSGNAAKIRVLHLGVADVEPVPCYARSRPFTLICAANLEPVKGHRFLIEALRAMAAHGLALRCVLAGDGSQREALVRAVKTAGLEGCVTFEGHVAHEQLLAALSSGGYDAAVLASTESDGLHEGIPAFLMEAMAAGLPCIATKTGSIDELISADCGILVEQQNPAALARAIELVSADDELRQRLGAAARARVREQFSATRAAQQLRDWVAPHTSAPTRRAMSETTLARS